MKNTGKKIKILIVEDDRNLGMILKDYLEILGYQISQASDGEEGLLLFKKNKYDLLILDVLMPKKDGFTLAADIRSQNLKIPIIFVTAKNQKDDRIKGFQLGCDDYIAKPFSIVELSLRIQVILKRCLLDKENNKHAKHEVVMLGAFLFDAYNMSLTFKNKKQMLTRKESALLNLLYQYKNEVVPREVALEKIWGENDYFIGRSMDVFISRLRKYLKVDASVNITNVHGLGFRLEVKES